MMYVKYSLCALIATIKMESMVCLKGIQPCLGNVQADAPCMYASRECLLETSGDGRQLMMIIMIMMILILMMMEWCSFTITIFKQQDNQSPTHSAPSTPIFLAPTDPIFISDSSASPGSAPAG